MKTNKTETLAKASKELMLMEPFYGIFLIMLNKIWNNKVPTAGVGLNGINYHLYINEEFWNNLEPNHKIGLLKHELLHIGFFHLTMFKHMSNHTVANIAQDLEINQYIDDKYLPPGGMKLELFPELKLLPKKGSQYYYDELMKAAKNPGTCENLDNMLEGASNGSSTVTVKISNNPGETERDVNIPDHSTWGEIEGLGESGEKLVNKQVEHILKEISQQVEKSRGTVPGEFAEILNRINATEPPKFDWKGFLRRFVGGSTETFTKKTRRKHNKRYDENPGLKIKYQKHVLVAIDTSGSVSTDELKEFMGEIYHIKKTGGEVTILQADTTVRDISKLKLDHDFKIHGRGGTDFQPAVDYFNENIHKYTCMIYFTDGEAPAPEGVKGRILWALSSTSRETDELPGVTIKLN
jgi:predicted metal-dependent peptidase